ncbi:ornithine carbamoyltransferase [Nocardioides marmorisolisilvae]|uniref:Ornithine carbamoyltransferase n=1 Tax=Nocardioides marmorisolisilvae TaxID=1542737 RepID=A0A3N0DUG5_9ACTN|nr:ornithine carbamoyltransferase [Nocardioides marmorisolisilvae]RNL79262.1 ornithine carbamoyltransferase [Nocardioides marmorisolisilvae]
MSTPSPIKHFLRDDDLTAAEQAEVLDLAAALKAAPYDSKPLAGPQTVAIIFDKPTLRTQASFVAGIAELGGHPMVVDGNLAQIGTRESIADVARVLGRQASLIVWRTHDQSRIEEMAAYAGVPVVNALTDQFHPCQTLADLLTIREHKGSTAGLTMTFLGDAACNMGHSYLLSGALAGMHVRVSGPDGFQPDPAILARAQEIAAGTGGSAQIVDDPKQAAEGADVLITDTWISMGKEAESADRAEVFRPWQLNADLLALGNDAIVMHCLPAYRGKEITADVLDGPSSVIWDEAENRRHAQKAIMQWLVTR